MDAVPWTIDQCESSIDVRFRRVAEAHARRVAIVDGERRLLYQELFERVEHGARRLSAELPRATSEPTIVALYFDQGCEATTALLAVWRAGACALCLDPSLPRERIEQLLRDAGPELIWTDERHLSSTKRSSNGTPVHAFDVESPPAHASRPPQSQNGDAAALLLYTSGSTGRPKAVVHTHRSLLHNALRHRRAFAITPEDRQSQLYACGVYGGVRDLLNALLNGASLHVYSLRDHGSAGLSEFLASHEITIYCSVVTVFRKWIHACETLPTGLHLRWLKLGGEAPHPEDLRHFRQIFPDGCHLSLGLGSTETGMVCQIGFDASRVPDSVVLGRPVDDVEVEIVDSTGHPVAEGEVGEIRVRSRFLAAGYRGGDGSNGRFSHDPTDAGMRIYHTGDLGLRRPDGILEHRGRADLQVKIRGNRLEPGEIESALLSHPDIVSAAIVTPANTLGEPQVVAWLVHTPDRRPRTEEVRAWIRERLPEFMVPSHIRWLPSMPQTASGKIDRAGLLSRGLEPAVPRPRIQPTSGTEEKMWALFEEVLERPVESVTDDFFELGGNSLLAVELLSRMREKLGRALEIEDLLFIPTVERLSGLWDDGASDPVAGPRCVRGSGAAAPLFCLPGQGGTVFIYRRLAQLIPPTRPVYAFQLPGLRRDEIPHASIEALATHFVRGLRSVQPRGPYHLLGYSFGGTTAYEMARQLEAVGEDVAFLGLIDTMAPGMRRPRTLRARLGARRRQLAQWWSGRDGSDRARRLRSVGSAADEGDSGLDLQGRIARTTAAARQGSRAYLGGRFGGRLVLFRAREWRRTLSPDLQSPGLGWEKWVAGGVEVHEIEGSHLALFDDDFLPMLAEHVRDALSRDD